MGHTKASAHTGLTMLMQVNALSAYGLLANMADPWLGTGHPPDTSTREVWLANTAGGSLLGKHLISLAKAKYSRGPLTVRVVAVVRSTEQRDELLAAGYAPGS